MDFKKANNSVRNKFLYIILIEFGIPLTLVRLIKMCLSEMCSRIRVGKISLTSFQLEMFETRRFSFAIVFTFAFDYAIKRIQVNQDTLKLNGTHQLLAYADDVT
jgi:hypothetical protein